MLFERVVVAEVDGEEIDVDEFCAVSTTPLLFCRLQNNAIDATEKAKHAAIPIHRITGLKRVLFCKASLIYSSSIWFITLNISLLFMQKLPFLQVNTLIYHAFEKDAH